MQSEANQRPSEASGTVKVSRKWSMAFGYLPPLVSSLLFGGMYHSAAITCGEAIRDNEGGNQGCTTPLRSPEGGYPRQ
jgi:hypothetical protein